MKISQLITGIILMIGGISLIILTFFISEAKFVTLFYGIPLFIIGIYILLNEKEDKIEQIKNRK